MSSFQIFKFGIIDHHWMACIFFDEHVNDVPRQIMKEVRLDIYEWLDDYHPEIQYGSTNIVLEPFHILTLAFQDLESIVEFKLTWGGGILANPQNFSSAITSKYF